MNIELTERERKLIALALHGLATRQRHRGKDVLDAIWDVAVRLGVDAELRQYTKRWIAFALNNGRS